MNLRAILFGILLLCIGAVIAFRVKDPERRVLDGVARQKAPGQFVSLPDGQTHYEEAGPDTGRTVVLAAGFSVPGYIWDSLYFRLADAGFRVIRYDYYGRGWSDRARVGYNQAMFVRQLDALLDSLEVTQVDLAGLSFGGTVVTSYVAAHPERVRTLIYVDPVFNNARTPTPVERSALRWDWEMVMKDGAAKMALGQRDDFFHPERHPDWVDRYRVQQQFKGTREALRRSRISLQTDPVQDTILVRLGQEPRPVMIIWGRHDNTVPFAESDKLRAAFPTSTFLPVDSAGHLPHLEEAALVADSVIGFLRAH
ncbi:MAG TPA: alpha/beta hydrolase [Gemmatimonadales bacterium]|nr:alpha/beta hydrolase [Gemmatimonadales bacterium]